jgi:pyridoxamine 5'-phosphate oxidase
LVSEVLETMTIPSIADLRKDYTQAGLEQGDPSPFKQFELWFNQALAADLLEPNAMTLATVTSEGRPDARIVLLKGFDARGFVFYTNYRSQKGQELAANPHAALVFLWGDLERQVRVVGRVEKATDLEADTYFQSRPLGSRLGAWASTQSEVIPSREFLEARMVALEAEYQGREIPRPDHWGGLRVVPTEMEFWQGRPSRLHDRLRYRLQENGVWVIDRLAP